MLHRACAEGRNVGAGTSQFRASNITDGCAKEWGKVYLVRLRCEKNE